MGARALLLVAIAAAVAAAPVQDAAAPVLSAPRKLQATHYPEPLHGIITWALCASPLVWARPGWAQFLRSVLLHEDYALACLPAPEAPAT